MTDSLPNQDLDTIYDRQMIADSILPDILDVEREKTGSIHLNSGDNINRKRLNSSASSPHTGIRFRFPSVRLSGNSENKKLSRAESERSSMRGPPSPLLVPSKAFAEGCGSGMNLEYPEAADARPGPCVASSVVTGVSATGRTVLNNVGAVSSGAASLASLGPTAISTSSLTPGLTSSSQNFHLGLPQPSQSPFGSPKLSDGVSETDAQQVEMFYKSHKTEVTVCHCLANLYLGQKSKGNNKDSVEESKENLSKGSIFRKSKKESSPSKSKDAKKQDKIAKENEKNKKHGSKANSLSPSPNRTSFSSPKRSPKHGMRNKLSVTSDGSSTMECGSLSGSSGCGSEVTHYSMASSGSEAWEFITTGIPVLVLDR